MSGTMEPLDIYEKIAPLGLTDEQAKAVIDLIFAALASRQPFREGLERFVKDFSDNSSGIHQLINAFKAADPDWSAWDESIRLLLVEFTQRADAILKGVESAATPSNQFEEDARRYAQLFTDTWANGYGVAVFRYRIIGDHDERLSLSETNEELDAIHRTSPPNAQEGQGA